jgi:hypothetical protein
MILLHQRIKEEDARQADTITPCYVHPDNVERVLPLVQGCIVCFVSGGSFEYAESSEDVNDKMVTYYATH